VVEKVLGLYREKYFDLNLRHFHLHEERQVEISCSWVRGLPNALGNPGKVRGIPTLSPSRRLRVINLKPDISLVKKKRTF